MYRRVLLVLCLAGLSSADLTHLDRLLNRLDGSSPPPLADITTPSPPHRVRHGHLHHDLQQQYDLLEEEDEDDVPQADIQPRNPHTSSVSRKHFHFRKPSTLGRPDWKFFASRKHVEKTWANAHSRMSKANEFEKKEQSAVQSHLMKMPEFQCKVPHPKIVRVADHYPDHSGSYLPSCTKLHVCAEDTGCCGPKQKCGPKATSKVELYFYVTVDIPTLRGSRTLRTEKLVFYNHTECACQDRSDEMPRDTDLSSGLDTNNIPDQPLQYKCKCPSEYTVRNLANGSCTCDCFDKQRDCTKYKKGKENFNQHDRLCIEMGKCSLPACDFGVYNRRLGRCPRKHEKFRSWARYKL